MTETFFDPIALQQLLERLRTELAIHKATLAILMELSKKHQLGTDFSDTQTIITRLESRIAETERKFTTVN